jgi:DNA invertase Pin-like site-specific DNA recombinase
VATAIVSQSVRSSVPYPIQSAVSRPTPHASVYEIVTEQVIKQLESGVAPWRKPWRTMFKDASQRKFDVLLFWALDRLSREGVLETLQHLSRLTAFGVGYRSFTEQYFDSCGVFKDAVIAIIATVAKQERVRISQRVRAGLDLARAKGRTLGRPRIAVDSPRIALLRAQGRSWSDIVRETGVSKGTAQRAVRSLPKNV